jgi:hypothetical protein
VINDSEQQDITVVTNPILFTVTFVKQKGIIDTPNVTRGGLVEIDWIA